MLSLPQTYIQSLKAVVMKDIDKAELIKFQILTVLLKRLVEVNISNRFHLEEVDPWHV